MSFLVELMEITRSLGGDRFRFCDTLGIMDPFTMFDKVSFLRLAVPEAAIEVHTHNDLGMATANAIAGIRAGARFANTTINGLGERAGNAALEEVVMGLKHACGLETGIDTHRFREMSLFVAKASHRPRSVSKPEAASLLETTETRVLTMLNKNELQVKNVDDLWYVDCASLKLCEKPKASDIVKPGCGGH